jgi:hypothetical protein
MFVAFTHHTHGVGVGFDTRTRTHCRGACFVNRRSHASAHNRDERRAVGCALFSFDRLDEATTRPAPSMTNARARAARAHVYAG